jgi:putative membrane protein
MRNILTTAIVLGIGVGSAFAQGAPSSSPTPPAVSTSNMETKTSAAPVAGANSFTESEARSRLEKYGYSDVGALTKDGNSIWRGMAKKDGKEVNVALDYQGNIVNQ